MKLTGQFIIKDILLRVNLLKFKYRAITSLKSISKILVCFHLSLFELQET